MIFKPIRNSIWALISISYLHFNGFHNELKILGTENNIIKKNKAYSYKLVSLTLCCIIVSLYNLKKKIKISNSCLLNWVNMQTWAMGHYLINNHLTLVNYSFSPKKKNKNKQNISFNHLCTSFNPWNLWGRNVTIEKKKH